MAAELMAWPVQAAGLGFLLRLAAGAEACRVNGVVAADTVAARSAGETLADAGDPDWHLQAFHYPHHPTRRSQSPAASECHTHHNKLPLFTLPTNCCMAQPEATADEHSHKAVVVE